MVADALERFRLTSPGDRVLCALSGGADSVCLTHALWAVAEERGLTLAAAHFSHGLRPESAEAERQLCQRLCDSLSIPLFCGEGDTAAYAATHGLGLEEAARQLRRKFLLKTAEMWQADAIATGHHLEDSAETLLFNLIRGTGEQGLQGIPPRAGTFIRPLILAEKSEILQYIRENGLEYAQDPTNFSGENTRARMRREVFPALCGINSAAVRHLAHTALENWQRDEGSRLLAEAFAARCAIEEGRVSAPVEGLLALPEGAAVRVLQTLQRQAGGRMLERPHVEALLALCRSSRPSAETHLPGSRAFRQYDRLVLTRETPPQTPAARTLNPGETACFGGWEVSYLGGEGALTLRSRQEGDRICLPFGSKSVKKLLIEQKIPREMRDTVPIICQGDKILAVGDLCTAHLPEKEKREIICRRIRL